MNPLEASLSVVASETANRPDMELMAAKARGLMRGYDKRWSGQQFITLVVEETITSSLFNPTTKARSRTFELGGKIDVRAELDGEIVIIDHKTTSEDISDPNATYWRQLIIESQLSHYLLMEWLNGRKPAKAMWDVIRKPSISPRQLTKAEQKEIAFDKSWFGFALTDEEIQDALATQKETMRLFELRLAHDCMVERPDRYFQRRTIPRLDSEIFEYAGEVWDHSQDIILARRNNRHPRNSGACMQYGSPCQFLGVCSGYDEIDSDKWQRSEWVHPELPQVMEGSGSELLTNSRLRTWQTCRRKHKFQYEIGIERTEDREALIFGDLIHKALAAWWEHFKQGEQYGYSNSATASGVAVA
jgi:hypothetical protein